MHDGNVVEDPRWLWQALLGGLETQALLP